MTNYVVIGAHNGELYLRKRLTLLESSLIGVPLVKRLRAAPVRRSGGGFVPVDHSLLFAVGALPPHDGVGKVRRLNLFHDLEGYHLRAPDSKQDRLAYRPHGTRPFRYGGRAVQFSKSLRAAWDSLGRRCVRICRRQPESEVVACRCRRWRFCARSLTMVAWKGSGSIWRLDASNIIRRFTAHRRGSATNPTWSAILRTISTTMLAAFSTRS